MIHECYIASVLSSVILDLLRDYTELLVDIKIIAIASCLSCLQYEL
jgi:hypothetical protein